MNNESRDSSAPKASAVVCAMQDHCATVARWWFGVCERATTKDFSTRRILVVDDEAIVVQVVENLIRSRLGCQVTTVSSGDEALRLLAEEPYDVLIADMMMPGLHGLELLSAARQQSPDTDILVMTGFPNDFPFVEVIHAGANDFIAKPHPPEELEAKVVRLLKERDVRDARLLADIKYRSLFELSMNGMLLLEPDTYAIVDANAAFRKLSGRSKNELLGMTLHDLLAPAEWDRLKQSLGLFAKGGQGTLSDLAFAHMDGTELSLDVSATFISTIAENIVFLAFKDVTEKRELEQRLAKMAQTDKLTGLANRHTFDLRLAWAIARARGERFAVSLLAMDVDDFKLCNDTYGHPSGDKVLKGVGDLIRKNIRVGGDEGFRCGGDEFAVLLMGVHTSTAKRIAERIRVDHRQGESYGTGLSIGIAELEDGMEAPDLIGRADEALYRAKALGKNVIQVASTKGGRSPAS